VYKKDSEKEQALWLHYQDGQSNSEADLVNHYMPFAQMMAKKQYKLLGFSQRDFDDFMQNAYMGLMDAIPRFDKSNGADFHTYASIRIKGAILNGIKQLSEKSQYYAYIKRVQSERFESIARSHNITGKDSLINIGEFIIELAYSHLLEGLVPDQLSIIEVKETPYDICQLQQTQQAMAKYLQRLPDRERQVLTWHYFEYFTFQEIADLLGVSKGRASQLHHQALQRLRDYCSNSPELLA
jgi:RNA polymerase sigma factor, sigma-70 family